MAHSQEHGETASTFEAIVNFAKNRESLPPNVLNWVKDVAGRLQYAAATAGGRHAGFDSIELNKLNTWLFDHVNMARMALDGNEIFNNRSAFAETKTLPVTPYPN